MTLSTKKNIGRNILQVWIQELLNSFCNINQHDTETLGRFKRRWEGDLETEHAVIAYREVDEEDDEECFQKC
jgi:hypothetical protein